MADEETKYPKVFFSVTEHLAPRIVHNEEEEAALDLADWTTIPPEPPTKSADEDEYPKIFFNVNVPAVVVHNPSERAQLGSAWVELDLATQRLTLQPVPEPNETL